MAERYLVSGGTGTTGSLLARRLRQDGAAVRVGTRRPRTEGQVRFDWTDGAIHRAAVEGVDGVYRVAPTDRTDHLEAMRPFLETAVAAGVGRFVLLSASVLAEGGPMMGEVHAWTRAHAPGWVLLRPSWFMQSVITQHAAPIRDPGEIASANGDGRVPFIDADDIAAVADAALGGQAGPSGEILLSGPEALSTGEVARLASEVAGRTVRHLDCRSTSAWRGMCGTGWTRGPPRCSRAPRRRSRGG